MGVACAIAITIITRQFSLGMIAESLMATIRISSMICIPDCGLGFPVSFNCISAPAVADHEGIELLQLSPYGVLAILAALYIVLGMFIDGTSMTVMTVPIAVPLIVQAGYESTLFGVFLVIMIELSALTPPVGLNLYILQGLTSADMGRTVLAALPFFLLLCLGTVLLVVFPEIALWLQESSSRIGVFG